MTPAFLPLALVCFGSQEHKSKLSSDLAKVAVQSNVQVIVQWKIATGTTTTEKIVGLGGTVLSEFKSINAGVYTVSGSALKTLDADPLVNYVSIDRQVHRKLAYTAAAINAPYAWKAGYTGIGIGIAVIDSGINNDPNLGDSTKNRLVYTQDFTVPVMMQPDGKPAPPPHSYGLDWYGHGQHIAGIIASNGKDSSCGSCVKTFVEIAPGANLVNLKVLDENGQGTDSSVIAAIDQAIALKATYNVRVINLSLGRPVFESYTQDPLCQAAEAAWKAGIVVVVAAGNDGRDNSFGNDGYGTITAPGNDPYVITVGAMKTENTNTRTDDLIASYSSKGPTQIDHIVKPDLVAPGNQIVSLLAKNATLSLNYPQNAVPLSYFQSHAPGLGKMPNQPIWNGDSNTPPPNANFGSGTSNSYFILNGTSMAAAVVSGAVADILHAKPKLTPDQVKILLMETSSKTFPMYSTVTDSTTGQTYVSYYDIFTVGAGYLDLQAALTFTGQLPLALSAMSPAATYDAATGDVTLVFDPGSIFGNQAIWGAQAIWGSSVLSGNQAIWGTGTESASESVHINGER